MPQRFCVINLIKIVSKENFCMFKKITGSLAFSSSVAHRHVHQINTTVEKRGGQT